MYIYDNELFFSWLGLKKSNSRGYDWCKPRKLFVCIRKTEVISLYWIKKNTLTSNDHDGVSNHQPHGCLLNRLFLFRAQIKENIKAPRHWPLCGEFTGTGEFPAQRASNAENVSNWWRHHAHYSHHTHEFQDDIPQVYWKLTIEISIMLVRSKVTRYMYGI